MSQDQHGPDGAGGERPVVPGAAPGQPTPHGPPVPPPYGQPVAPVPPPYGQPGASAARPTTDGVAIAALVTGILGMGVVPLILGIMGLKRTKANGTSGRGFSIAGIVLGALAIVASIVAGILLIVLAVNAGDVVSSVSSAAASQTAVAEPDKQPSGDSGAVTGSSTLLRDAVPLKVGGFTTAGLATDDAVVAAGALEAYAATYTDGTSTVGAALSHWASAEQAQAWAASQDARFTAAQVVDTGELNGGEVKYRYYEVDGVVTLVATDSTVAMTMTGPSAAAEALYKAFPI